MERGRIDQVIPKYFYSLQLIAVTGQMSIASWQLQVLHFSGLITYAFSSSLSSNTSGHASTQAPHPMQVSLSTTGIFMFHLLLPVCILFILNCCGIILTLSGRFKRLCRDFTDEHDHEATLSRIILKLAHHGFPAHGLLPFLFVAFKCVFVSPHCEDDQESQFYPLVLFYIFA